MIATITAGGTDMSGCRHGRKKKKKSLRYQGGTAELLLIHTCTELTCTVSMIRFWKFNLSYVVKTCFRKAEAVVGRGGSSAQIGQNGLLPLPFFGGCFRKSVPLWGCLDQGFLPCTK